MNRQKATLMALAALTAVAWPAPAWSSQELHKQMGGLARAVLDVVKDDPVSVGAFTAKGVPDSNAGPGLEKILTDELNALKKGIVKPKARFAVNGEYLLVASPRRGARHKVIQIVARVTERKTSSQTPLAPVFVDDTRTVAEVVQATAVLPVNASRGERIDTIDSASRDRKVCVDGTKVLADESSKFAVELYVKDDKADSAKPLTPRKGAGKDAGMAFVNVPQGAVYEVWVTNHHEFEAAVTVSIDGHDVFTFSDDRDSKTGRPLYSHHIVPARKTVAIRGWHKTNASGPDNVTSFLVTAYGEGASARAPSDSNKVGVVTVTFAAAWADEKGRPGDEPDGRRVGENETGFGPPQKQALETVKRQVGVVREVVSIRYTR